MIGHRACIHDGTQLSGIVYRGLADCERRLRLMSLGACRELANREVSCKVDFRSSLLQKDFHDWAQRFV